jgi:hypothetical protein
MNAVTVNGIKTPNPSSPLFKSQTEFKTRQNRHNNKPVKNKSQIPVSLWTPEDHPTATNYCTKSPYLIIYKITIIGVAASISDLDPIEASPQGPGPHWSKPKPSPTQPSPAQARPRREQ